MSHRPAVRLLPRAKMHRDRREAAPEPQLREAAEGGMSLRFGYDEPRRRIGGIDPDVPDDVEITLCLVAAFIAGPRGPIIKKNSRCPPQHPRLPNEPIT